MYGFRIAPGSYFARWWAKPDFNALSAAKWDTVAFVRSYVEFRIDYDVLRAPTPPQILLPNGQRHQFPHAGSRDALCTLIDAYVIEACERGGEDEDDLRIEVRTDSGHLLTIPLDSRNRVGPEAAQLVPADENGRLETIGMWIW